ncbi:MAG TPA: hypothetical protein VLI06_20770 [Solimonas sp.]|nr:hypothetical protein [Solimonas sp.]
MLCLLLELQGCATLQELPWTPTGGPDIAPVVLLEQALQASPAERESLWRSLREQNFSSEQKLRRALLQSIPEHSGHNPGAAQRQLRQLVVQPLAPDLRAVAQLRLRELDASEQCQIEVRNLRQRMATVIDIERQLNNRSRP